MVMTACLVSMQKGLVNVQLRDEITGMMKSKYENSESQSQFTGLTL